MSLGFDRETIRLSIPRSGVILQSGWKVKARYDPVVSHEICFPCGCSICSCVSTGAIYKWKLTLVHSFYTQIRKGNIDHFCGGQMIPKCELLLRWPHPDKPHACLEHEINLVGTKGCSFFTLYIPDAGEQYLAKTVS